MFFGWISGLGVWVGMPVSFVLLLCWMYSRQRQMVKAGVKRLQFTPLGVVVAWFLPKTCLIRPYEAMKDLYTVSTGKKRDGWTPLAGIWWATWLMACGLML